VYQTPIVFFIIVDESTLGCVIILGKHCSLQRHVPIEDNFLHCEHVCDIVATEVFLAHTGAIQIRLLLLLLRFQT